MADLSPAGEALTLALPVWLSDHRVLGQVVLPAVEALQALARTLPPAAGADPHVQAEARFAHLLTIDGGLATVPAEHQWEPLPGGGCRSRLTTLRQGREGGWRRRVEHAAVTFLPRRPRMDDGGRWPVVPAAVPPDGSAGPAFGLSAERLYEALVPFGPAYRNVTGVVRLTPADAVGELSGGAFPEVAGPLGSPFPLDAAFHLACAWGQRYRGVVAFPVGFARREIRRPTRAGERYRCRVVPRPVAEASLRFDLTIVDAAGRPAEILWGLEMRDLSRGRLRPPDWVREDP